MKRGVLIAATLLVASFSTFLLAELGLRVSYALRDRSPPHSDRSTAEEWQWAKEHLEAGAAVLADSVAHFVYHPGLGWITRPDQDREGVRTNSVGMRSAVEFGLERVPGRPRILFVGDSYTFGQGVSNHETFQSVLARDYLKGWEVMNFGVSGYGAGQMLLLFEQVGASYRPDVVVLGFFERGFLRTQLRFRGYSKPYFMLSDGKLELFGTPVIAPEELYRLYEKGERRYGGWNHSYVAAEIGRTITRNFSDLDVTREGPVWQLIAAILARFDRSVREAGAQPFLLIITDRPGSTRRERLYQRLNDLAQEEAAELGLPVLSLRAALSEEVASTIHRPREIGGHLSVRGHELVAQHLAAALVRMPPLKTNSAPASGPRSQQ